jgi:hypothetical protein
MVTLVQDVIGEHDGGDGASISFSAPTAGNTLFGLITFGLGGGAASIPVDTPAGWTGASENSDGQCKYVWFFKVADGTETSFGISNMDEGLGYDGILYVAEVSGLSGDGGFNTQSGVSSPAPPPDLVVPGVGINVPAQPDSIVFFVLTDSEPNMDDSPGWDTSTLGAEDGTSLGSIEQRAGSQLVYGTVLPVAYTSAGSKSGVGFTATMYGSFISGMAAASNIAGTASPGSAPEAGKDVRARRISVQELPYELTSMALRERHFGR